MVKAPGTAQRSPIGSGGAGLMDPGGPWLTLSEVIWSYKVLYSMPHIYKRSFHEFDKFVKIFLTFMKVKRTSKTSQFGAI